MAIKLKRPYRFAFRSAVLISLFGFLILSILMYLFQKMDWPILGLFSLLVFLGSFAILQVRIQKFIYRRIKKIYDDVALLDSSSFAKGPITTDMRTLTEEIEKFAQDKKIEIDTLKIREEYRKDFLGNVSHELKTTLFTVQGYILT
ncbi:MAG: sensor histidine kinase, partial [Bacteroidota bacterium]